MYKNISKGKNNVFYYTGQILPSQEFNSQLNLSDVCIDLYSLLAYALVNEIHWYNNDAKHLGLRYVQKVAYIIKGRPLVKKFRKECA